MLEEINLECMNVYAEKAQNGTSNIQISMDEVYANLTNEMKDNIETVGGTSKISLLDSTQSSITLLNDAEAIGSTGRTGQNTVNIEVKEEKNSTSYYLKANGMYYPMSIRNLKVELDEENASNEPPTGAGSLGSGIEITFIDSGETEEKTESDFVTVSKNGTTITLTAKADSDGSTQVVVRDGSVTLTGNIDVTVNPTYTISLGTMTNGSVGITTNNIDTTSNEKYGSGVEITLTATGATNPKRYAFEKWSDNASTDNPRKITVNETTVQVTYIATFVESKLYGAQVLLNGGKPITVKGNNTVDDNWKLFYIDDDDNDDTTDEYVHLIYGDYYPVDVQTDPDTGSTNTINLAPTVKSPYTSKPWGVNAASKRLQLLQYLKNNLNYKTEDLDGSTPAGDYESWENLADALTGVGKALVGKSILVQGAPNITMWRDSWNEQGYNTKIVLDSIECNSIGYKISVSGVTPDKYDGVYQIHLRVDINGYNDKLYFPYKGESSSYGRNADKAGSYWLASPSGYDDENLYTVVHESSVSGGGHCTRLGSICARPVISILKSDFQELFPTISIQK